MHDLFYLIFQGVFLVLSDFFIHSDFVLLIFLFVIFLAIFYFVDIIKSLRGF